MLDKMIDSINFSAQALKLRAHRQEALTSNISNADTPNYKAIDFKFEDALKAVTNENRSLKKPTKSGVGNSTGGTGSLAITHQGHIAGKSSANASTSAMLQFRRGNNAAIDGNSVDLDRERAAFAENTVKYEAALKTINGRISTLKQAMGSVNQ